MAHHFLLPIPYNRYTYITFFIPIGTIIIVIIYNLARKRGKVYGFRERGVYNNNEQNYQRAQALNFIIFAYLDDKTNYTLIL